MELALLSIVLDVVFPFDHAGLPVERTNHSVAGTNDEQVAHDRGSGEDSASGIELPEDFGVGQTGLGILRRKKHRGQKQRGKESQNSYSHVHLSLIRELEA